MIFRFPVTICIYINTEYWPEHSFKDKKTDVIYIKSLNQALRHVFNLRKVHRVIRIAQSFWMRYYVTKQNFKDRYPFGKSFFAVKIGKSEIKMNKPVYLGETILDLGKTLMYKFHYDHMQVKYGSKLKLC